MTPKLSIITPSLNQAAYVERTLRSVLDQEYPNLEYIVVDGGSSDGSVEIIKRYEDRLAWWVSEPDHGQTDAINKGLRRATGDIVAYINSDDYYLPGAFEAAVAALDGAPESWAVGASRFVDVHDELNHVWEPRRPSGSRAWWILRPWGAPQPSSFWRREAFDRHGLFREDMHYVFDTEFQLRLALAGEPPALIPGELAVRMEHEEAKSWDVRPFREEQARFVDIFKPVLSRRERFVLAFGRLSQRIGLVGLAGTLAAAYRRLRR